MLLYLISATRVIPLSNNDSFDGTKLFSFHVFDHIKKYQNVNTDNKRVKANRKKNPYYVVFIDFTAFIKKQKKKSATCQNVLLLKKKHIYIVVHSQCEKNKTFSLEINLEYLLYV